MAKAAVAKITPADEVEVFDCEQGSDEWHELRRGIPTASRFSSILAQGEGKMRNRLLYQLAGEILTGEVAETYRNDAMDRGNSMEASAYEHYAFTRGVELTRIGFVRRTIARAFEPHDVVGASPDAFIGKDGILEIKTMRPDLLIELALKGAAGLPSEHCAQVQGNLWVTGRSWCDLMIYYRGMPVAPTFRIERGAAYIDELANAVEIFHYDLRQLVAKIRSMGK